MVTLRDHQSGYQFTWTSETLAGVADALEALLGSGKVPWRPFKSYKVRGLPKLPPAEK